MKRYEVEHFLRILDGLITDLELKRENAECKRANDILFKKIEVIVEAKEKIEREWL
ncbi:hypothetical protein IAI10_16115 [Clostridium sp. 19966]|uniref:hypothetical protein n=1 Tax=Clostridium sp. 19966 TaxID=2768166 RepID=UPI0028DD57E0|nr:hypothetical protein [Clostridium sp. 19966]MDT8718192.1 hypothetical protein [Clostridium sp. 19966]